MKKSKAIKLLLLAGLLTACGTTKDVSIKLSGPQVTASAKELVRITDDVVAEFQPSLSSDGKQLLYVIRDDAQGDNNKWSIRLKKDVMLPGFTPLIGKKTGAPSWVNNSGDFIFTYYASNPVIATSNINRLGITYVGQNAYGDFDNNAQVSPDGQKVVLTTSLQGARSICIVNKDGSSFTVLSEGIEPEWHPNGDIILYSKLSGDYYQLFELNLDTYQSTQITTGESNSYNGTYSPDGNHISFISSKDDNYGHLFVMKRNGQSITQLTSGDSNEVQPFWGTDGFIYFASTAGAKRPEKAKKKWSILESLLSDKNNSLNRELISTSFLYSDIWRVKPLIVN
ncbi:MAG: hypothetical protein ED556_04850 [Winogradskyella sp.]|uniref:TolB family protein n=1 Tax=Winogradskyella sp. TaxID=1883156 RepID=UPI000F40EDF5|nr:hypothetical protein [Winogradskyella sp.]RNC86752.1 MAG: hypothetical protein ED556_04850 [Winogradskyella sp.]